MSVISDKALESLNEMISELENKDKMTATDVILLRLFIKMRDNKALPWDKPFIAPCINVISEKEYRGINRLLLDEGEYLTMKQLIEYNKKHNTNYRLSPILDTDSDKVKRKKSAYCIVFYKSYLKKLTSSEVEDYKKGKPLPFVVLIENGELVKKTFTMRYYKVFNTEYIFDGGTPFPKKLGNEIVNELSEPDDIANKYLKKEGIKLSYDGKGSCYYSVLFDSIHMTDKQYFSSIDEYYRTLFHEMTHSTGTKKRLDRVSLRNYSKEYDKHCKEEVIAELGSLLLASEAGLDCRPIIDNSDNYILGWFKYFYSKPSELITAMFQAEKARDYILWWNKSDIDVEDGNE